MQRQGHFELSSFVSMTLGEDIVTLRVSAYLLGLTEGYEAA